MISAIARGGSALFGKGSGNATITFADYPDISVDEDIINASVDSLLSITIDHFPRQGGISVRTAGQPLMEVSR